MERKYHTYRYTNILNGMKYNGQTCRNQSDRAGLKGKGYKTSSRFWEGIQQYGWENFRCEILEEGLTQEEAWLKEQEHIREDNSQWPNGYNLASGGKGTLGFSHPNPHNEEWNSKISQAKINHSVSEETRKKISKSKKGKMAGENHWNYGKHYSEDFKKRLSEAHKGQIAYNRKRVLQIKDGQIKAEYSSASEASRITGLSQGNISSCCRGERKSAGGYVWKYTSTD